MGFKFAKLDENTEFTYPNHYLIEKMSARDRLVLAPGSRQVELMLELTKIMAEPFGILYVLVTSRRGHKGGRYRTAQPYSRAEMEHFLTTNRAFLEADGRHHLWIASLGDRSQLVYDNHNLIFAYGPVPEFTEIAKHFGLSEGEITIPTPHTHAYHAEFDDDEDRIFHLHRWVHAPLAADDDCDTPA